MTARPIEPHPDPTTALMSNPSTNFRSLADTLADQRNLDAICADRPVPKTELFDGNAFYGIASVLKRCAGLTDDAPLKATVPHGVVQSDTWVWDAELDAGLPVAFAYPFTYARNLVGAFANRPHRAATVIPIASPFLYLARAMQESQPSPERRGTLFFPCHSTHHTVVNMDFEDLADALVALDAHLQPVTVCVYWKDYLLGHAQPFTDRGLPVVSAGHIFDPEFLPRLYHLFSTHRHAASNSTGSCLFYAVAAGCHAFYHRADYAVDSGVIEATRDFSTSTSLRKAALESVFSLRPEALEEQRSVARHYLGATHLKSSIGLRSDLLLADALFDDPGRLSTRDDARGYARQHAKWGENLNLRVACTARPGGASPLAPADKTWTMLRILADNGCQVAAAYPRDLEHVHRQAIHHGVVPVDAANPHWVRDWQPAVILDDAGDAAFDPSRAPESIGADPTVARLDLAGLPPHLSPAETANHVMNNLHPPIPTVINDGPSRAESPPECWDYVSPGFQRLDLDSAFPNLIRGDRHATTWPWLRREVPHAWYVDRRQPVVGFLSRDEVHVLYNNALQFRDRPALEIGCWFGWSACHLAMAGVALDVIDPVFEHQENLCSTVDSLRESGVLDSVNLVEGRSPDSVHDLARRSGKRWPFIFIDGNHDAPGPLNDATACEQVAADDAMILFHDLASPDVARGFDYLKDRGWNTLLYQTMQIMGVAWRGNVQPVLHQPDPAVAWKLPDHLHGHPVSEGFSETADPMLEPPTLRNLLEHGLDLLNHRRNAEALRVFESARRQRPDEFGILFASAAAHARLGKSDRAISQLRELLDHVPGHHKARRLLAELDVLSPDASNRTPRPEPAGGNPVEAGPNGIGVATARGHNTPKPDSIS